MKKIDFRHFKVFTDISQTKSTVTDVSRDLADSIYLNANGIVAHDLAFRIYRSEGSIELSAEELAFLEKFLAQATPVFQDSFHANLTD